MIINKNYKNNYTSIIEIYQKKKKGKKENMQGIDIRTCLKNYCQAKKVTY